MAIATKTTATAEPIAAAIIIPSSVSEDVSLDSVVPISPVISSVPRLVSSSPAINVYEVTLVLGSYEDDNCPYGEYTIN